jgi:hypothetical protein
VEAQTSGTGSAGNFVITNALNTSAALNVETNGTGSAIQASQNNNGLALDVLGGGIKYPIFQTSTDLATIPNGAVIVEITANNITTNLPSGGQNGQIIYVTNNSGVAGTTTIGGGSLSNQAWATYIRLGGVWKLVI